MKKSWLIFDKFLFVWAGLDVALLIEVWEENEKFFLIVQGLKKALPTPRYDCTYKNNNAFLKEEAYKIVREIIQKSLKDLDIGIYWESLSFSKEDRKKRIDDIKGYRNFGGICLDHKKEYDFSVLNEQFKQVHYGFEQYHEDCYNMGCQGHIGEGAWGKSWG